MMLQYLRTTTNRSLALDVASVFIYNETNAATDNQASISLGRIEQSEPRLAKAVRIMEANIEDPVSIHSNDELTGLIRAGTT
jgi:transcriptional regulator GlxA family with amidase domain